MGERMGHFKSAMARESIMEGRVHKKKKNSRVSPSFYVLKQP
jgi:hypothetical protein